MTRSKQAQGHFLIPPTIFSLSFPKKQEQTDKTDHFVIEKTGLSQLAMVRGEREVVNGHD